MCRSRSLRSLTGRWQARGCSVATIYRVADRLELRHLIAPARTVDYDRVRVDLSAGLTADEVAVARGISAGSVYRIGKLELRRRYRTSGSPFDGPRSNNPATARVAPSGVDGAASNGDAGCALGRGHAGDLFEANAAQQVLCFVVVDGGAAEGDGLESR